RFILSLDDFERWRADRSQHRARRCAARGQAARGRREMKKSIGLAAFALIFAAAIFHICADSEPAWQQVSRVSFRRDVMPIFMQAGCNSGGCHGSARGKDGFHLSLFGYDPAGDYYRLTREQIGRRINLATPDASMLVTKCNGDAPHTGGKLFTKDSDNNQALIRWIEA